MSSKKYKYFTLKNFQKRKCPENDFLIPQFTKITILGVIFLTENLHFRGHLSTFRAGNTHKSKPLKAENNARTLPKQLQNNFEKVQNTTFSTPKMAKNDPSERPK